VYTDIASGRNLFEIVHIEEIQIMGGGADTSAAMNAAAQVRQVNLRAPSGFQGLVQNRKVFGIALFACLGGYVVNGLYPLILMRQPLTEITVCFTVTTRYFSLTMEFMNQANKIFSLREFSPVSVSIHKGGHFRNWALTFDIVAMQSFGDHVRLFSSHVC
jgi:hypothetical protein